MRNCARRWWRICARPWRAAFKMLEREAAKLALDLNQAQAAFQGFSGASAGAGARAHRDAGILLSDRDGADRGARAGGRTESGIGAHARPAGVAGQADRVASRSGWRRARRKRRIWNRGSSASRRIWKCTRRRWRSSKPKVLQRVNKCRPRPRSATSLQNDLRERERGIEARRQQVLRLLGEASTLRNQLAQIDEYLAAMERDAARLAREEEAASADLARLEQVKAELSAKLGARQMELESLGEQRRRVEEEIKERRARTVAARAEAGRGSRGAVAAEGAQGFARRNPFPSRLYDRKREAIVYRDRARTDRGFQAGGRAGGFCRSHRSSLGESLRDVPPR